MQSALLYSTSEGQRRIRCHNIAIPLVHNISECFDFLDIVSTSAFLARKAINNFTRMANVEACRSMVEATVNNMCKAYQRTAKVAKGEQFQFSENMQYLLMYVMGVLKAQVISLPMIMNPTDLVDRLVY